MKNNEFEKMSVLCKIPLFSGLDEREIAFLAGVAVERSVTKDEMLIREGENTRSLYIVLSGKANAVGARDGKKIILNTFGPGDYFGEMSFLDGNPRCASVEMEEPGRVLAVPSGEFRKRIGSNPKFMTDITKGLLLKLRNATEHIENLEFVMHHQDLHNAHIDTIRRLVLAAECKDDNTCNHIVRVSRYSSLIADKMGFDGKKIQNIAYAASMHDIGKIGIPRKILLKPGKLTKSEFEVMKTHTNIGARILVEPKSDILKYGCQIALWHHERFDGKGYPDGKSGKSTPVSAKIVKLADVFDALVSKRSYKEAFPVETAFEIIERDREKHFDPEIADAFLENTTRIRKIMQLFSPPETEFFPRDKCF